MRGKRFVSFIAALLLCVSMVFGALSPASVAAQADELSQREFDDLVETAQEDDPVYGPEEGELEHDPEIVTMAYAELEVADFLATVTVANPYAGSRNQFDYGIQFRTLSDGEEAQYLRFIVLSTGDWGVTDSAGEVIVQGTYDDLDDGRRGENELTVYAEAELVHVAINGDYVGSVAVDLEDAGDVAVGTSFFGDSYQEGAASEFVDFTVWELGGGSSRSNDDDDQPADDSGNDDRGPIGPRDNDSRDDDQPADDEPTPDDSDEPSRDTNEDDDRGNTSRGGAVYESPTYGYTFQYDDSLWEITAEDSSDGLDTVTLSDEISTLTFLAANPESGTPADCVDVLLTGFIDSLERADIAGDTEEIDSGEISRGPQDGAAFVEVLFTTEGESGDVSFVIYVVCGPVDNSDFIVGVRHFVIAEVYEDEAALRDAILATLSADGGASSDSGSDEPSRDNNQDEPSRDNNEDEPARDEEDEPSRDNNNDEPSQDDNQDEPAQEGAVYKSPSYGFTLRYDDAIWELSGESSNEGLDVATLSNGISTVSLFGLPGTTTPAECVEALLGLFVSSMEDAGIAGEIEVANQGQLSKGPLKGSEFAEVVFLGETDEGTVALAIYVSCGSIGGSDHHVGVRHFVLPDAYEGEAAARDDLLTGLSAKGEQPADTGNDDEPSRDEDKDEPRRDNDDDDKGSRGADSPNVERNRDGSALYTSPTYGFTVEILPGFSVEQDTVANGYDTLVISNEQARITVAGFASSNTAVTCLDSIIGNLNADPSFSNVNVPLDEQGAPIRIDEPGFSAVPVYLTFTENGQQVTVGRLYACFSFTGANGGTSMLVYAYETPADIFVDEFENIVAMLDLITVP